MSAPQNFNTCAEPARTRARRVIRSIAGALRTHYPGFALGLPLQRNTVPVFLYHDVDAERFARDLEFLRRNRYRTLSLPEFMAASVSKSGPPQRSVLLTFDDARLNFYDTALPVLRTFEARATLFVPSYWMSGSADREVERFMSWEQVRTSAQSGLVDVQSHGHRHALVFTSGRLLDFANPRTLARFDIYDWPMRNTATGDALGRPPLGTPIYDATPLLSAERRFLEDPGLCAACADLVTRLGGADYFQRPDWAVALRRLLSSGRGPPGRWLDAESFESLLASEFEHCRDLFQHHLGHSPQFLAYPWMLGSDRSLRIAKRFGLRAVFGVALDFGRAARGLPVPAFGRHKADWLPLLPGTGRSSFLAIAAGKVAGIAGTQHLAH